MGCGYGKRGSTGCGRMRVSILSSIPPTRVPGCIFYGELNRKRLLYDYGLQKWMTLDEASINEEEGAR